MQKNMLDVSAILAIAAQTVLWRNVHLVLTLWVGMVMPKGATAQEEVFVIIPKGFASALRVSLEIDAKKYLY